MPEPARRRGRGGGHQGFVRGGDRGIFLAGVAEQADNEAGGHDALVGRVDGEQGAGGRSLQLIDGLVGREFGQALAGLHAFARLLAPAGDGDIDEVDIELRNDDACHRN